LLGNLTPAGIYESRGRDIQTARWRLKRQTLRRRDRINRGSSAPKKEMNPPAVFRECLL
jgi:hypothetical protein